MSEENLMNALVELVTINGRPFNIIEDSGLKIIIDPISKAIGTSINRFKIKDLVVDESKKIQAKIIKGTKNKLISLKKDSAQRLGRNILGINIQYIKGNNIILSNLAMKEIKESSTSENIKRMIIETLNKFHIPLRNVYTITTDNGANLVKSIKLLNECSLDEMDDIDINNDDNNFEDISEFDIPEIIKDFSTKIYCIRCAAHTLQLAINDSLKNNIFKTIIDKARDVAKYLRTPTIVRILKSMKR
ncbi:unnamed protein product [Gordionus sp. m RMFG-2023]